MAEALGYVLGMKVQIVNTPFDSMIPSLQAGRADFLISDMLDTKKREQIVDFVDYPRRQDRAFSLLPTARCRTSPSTRCAA